MLTKKDLTDVLALSCVENYYLAWLKQYYEVSKLYVNSFISINQVFEDFTHGATYENYKSLPRLQEVAESCGLTTHILHRVSGETALEILKKQSETALCLIQVNANFFKNFKRAAWRNDHYICINGALKWVNQYPLSEGDFDKKEFLEIYDGKICIFEICDLKKEVPVYKDIYSPQEDTIEYLPNNLVKLESAIGVLRISRKRLEKYHEKNARIKNLLHGENEFMDKFYFDIHFSRLKMKEQITNEINVMNIEFHNQINTLIQFEKKLMEILING